MAHGEHKAAANAALDQLDAAITNLEGTKKHIDNQLELIPNFFAKKDQLGENTQQYIEEISQNLDESLIQKLTATAGNKNVFIKCAEELDEYEDEAEKSKNDDESE